MERVENGVDTGGECVGENKTLPRSSGRSKRVVEVVKRVWM